MNAIEIEEAISALFDKPCEPETFPAEFLEAFGNKTTTIKRLQSAASLSDIDGAVLLRNNIHLKVCQEGQVSSVFNQLKTSSTTTKNKVKFILVTDGATVEAEDLSGDAPLVCEYGDFPNHFGYFLPLAGIETVKQIRDSSFDIRATSRLNRLYVELLKDNPDWGTSENRHEMNHFMARLIFCFFAEDTDIFKGDRLFTKTVEQMSDRDSENTNEVISEIFRALNTSIASRASEKLPRWTEQFPYVNGGLFAGSVQVPAFSKIARSYLLHIGGLDWTKINPDIFGSMIQAVADDEERGALGMHYTSVPNILKVLNPLFLDDLTDQLKNAGDNTRVLLNLRKRISKIRVFDPACGSGNFLVIAYKKMREIEAEINVLRGEDGRKTDIPLTNFRGIELRDFPAEIARLALIIAEYQCDLLYRGQKEALDDFLPLDSQNWITCGNALRLDWLNLCPPTGLGVKIQADDLFETPLDQAQMDFENEGGETYICGNPPYVGSTWQSQDQKEDLRRIFESHTSSWKSLDYVAGWFMKAANYGEHTLAATAFVSTNSICQGQQVPILWPLIFKTEHKIAFAHTSFKWANLASHNAGVTVVIVGISKQVKAEKKIYSSSDNNEAIVKNVDYINAYLVGGANIIVEKRSKPISTLSDMTFGSKPVDGGNLLISFEEVKALGLSKLDQERFIRPILGSEEFINGKLRYCIWVKDEDLEDAKLIPELMTRFEAVKNMRLGSSKAATRAGAEWPHRFDERRQTGAEEIIVVPAVSSENRNYLPAGLLKSGTIITNRNFGLYDAPLWNFAIVVSRIHWVWIDTICGKLRTDFNYSNTLGWNTFPINGLTEKNKTDLSRCAEEIILAREAHFPATLADLYEPDKMPQDLRDAHDRNDEVIERIYVGRRFKNDTERLEKLFELYTKMTGKK
jgi:hypothetical protein